MAPGYATKVRVQVPTGSVSPAVTSISRWAIFFYFVIFYFYYCYYITKLVIIITTLLILLLFLSLNYFCLLFYFKGSSFQNAPYYDCEFLCFLFVSYNPL